MIQLEEIQGYLAHELRATNGHTMYKITIDCNEGKNVSVDHLLSSNEIFPVLFPIESIFQEVDFWGRCICATDSFSLEDYAKIKIAVKENKVKDLPFVIIEKFQEKHVDYQNLIPQGKAINALTLNK